MERKKYRHLQEKDRCMLWSLKKQGKNIRQIAIEVGVHYSTVARELVRNSSPTGSYCHYYAHSQSSIRRTRASSKRRKLTADLEALIIKMLRETEASPEQISGRLRKKLQIYISHETIYKMIWRDKKEGEQLYKYLRHQSKKYNKRGGKQSGRGLIPNRVDIEERPKIVEEKVRFGDFELDTIIGCKHRGAIVSIVERASKYSFFRLVQRPVAKEVSEKTCSALSGLSREKRVHTLTSDNGKEFAEHKTISKKTGGKFFFAKPYHSWERGLNEHTNGLVRQYFPKGTDFRTLTAKEVALVEKKLNNRPRKILDFDTPLEKVKQLCPDLPLVALQS